MMTDDQKYIRLIEEYRRLRSDPSKFEESERAFEAASRLKSSGKVSKKAVEATWYL